MIRLAMLRRVRMWLIGLLLVAVGVSLGWWLGGRQVASGRAELRNYGPAPAYTGFLNQNGSKVDSGTFSGKVRLVTFLFPYCTSYCPLIAIHLIGLESELRSAGLARRVQIVAFNVDPAHTGPRQARTFLAQYGWDPTDTAWQFLSGTPSATRHVVRDGYHVYYRQVSEAAERADAASQKANGSYIPQPTVLNPLARAADPDYDVSHNDTLVLVGVHGRIRWVSTEADRVTDAHLVGLIRRLLR